MELRNTDRNPSFSVFKVAMVTNYTLQAELRETSVMSLLRLPSLSIREITQIELHRESSLGPLSSCAHGLTKGRPSIAPVHHLTQTIGSVYFRSGKFPTWPLGLVYNSWLRGRRFHTVYCRKRVCLWASVF